MNEFTQEHLTTNNSLTANSETQAPPPLPARANDEYVIDGSEPATEDEIRELQQIGNPERLSSHYLVEYLCGLNHRPWGEYKDGKPISWQDLAQLLGRFQIEPNQQRMGSHGPVRGYNRQDFLATWAEHFDQPEETICTDPTSGTGTSDGTVEVQ